MKASEFIISRLEEIANIIEDIQIRYEYRESTQSHLIEILPLNIFENNEMYMEEEYRLEHNFSEQFPKENIVFISEGSLTEIKVAQMEFGRIRYNNDFSVTEFEIDGFNNLIESYGNYSLALAA